MATDRIDGVIDALHAKRARLYTELCEIDALSSFGESFGALPDLTTEGAAPQWLRLVTCTQSALAMLGEHYTESSCADTPTRVGRLCEEAVRLLGYMFDVCLAESRVDKHAQGAADERARIVKALDEKSAHYAGKEGVYYYWADALDLASRSIKGGQW
jgi:hypothetical protein